MDHAQDQFDAFDNAHGRHSIILVLTTSLGDFERRLRSHAQKDQGKKGNQTTGGYHRRLWDSCVFHHEMMMMMMMIEAFFDYLIRWVLAVSCLH